MRTRCVIIVALTELALTSCQTYGAPILSGRIRELAADDLRRVVAADRASRDGSLRDTLREIEVINRDEVHLFWHYTKSEYPGYNIVRRAHGKWHYDGQVLVTD